MNACVLPSLYDWGDTYEKLSYIYWQFNKYGKYVANAEGAPIESVDFGEMDCLAAGGGEECRGLESWRTGISKDWDSFERNAQSLQSYLYFAQIYYEQRFQEPQE